MQTKDVVIGTTPKISHGPRSTPMAIPLGAHLRVDRGAYWHHAIYVGAGMVIHYAGLSKNKATAAVRKDSFVAFRKSDPWEIVGYAKAFPPRYVVARALGRLGEKSYAVFGNNCEHFARWCKTGEQASEQVADAAAGTAGIGAGAALVAAGKGAVLAAGEAAGLKGGAGVMRGLAKAGGVVGRGAAAGLAVIAAAPVAASVIATRRVYRDDEMLSVAEREARAAARTVALVAGIGGVVGSMAVVSAVGMPGLSGAGITSGLTVIGKSVGGRMVAGLVITAVVPALLVGLAAYLTYRIRKAGQRNQGQLNAFGMSPRQLEV